MAAFIKQWRKFRSNLVGLADEFGNQLFGELDYRYDDDGEQEEEEEARGEVSG